MFPYALVVSPSASSALAQKTSMSTSRFRRAPRASLPSATPGDVSVATRHSHDIHMGFGLDDQQKEALADEASDDEVLPFSWDEEQSILAFLMEEGPKQSDQDRLDALVESLKEPFEDKSKQLKTELASSFISTVRQVKKVHRVLETSVDSDMTKGLTVFNNACKEMDAAALAEYEELTEAYEKTRANIANLMDQLKAECSHRDRLWMDLEKNVDEIAEPALAELQELPGKVERIIAKLEKGYEAMQNQAKEPTGFSEKRLKDLLNKLGESSLAL